MNLTIEAHKEAFRRIYRNSLYATVKELMGYKDVNWLTHGPIIKALESPTKRKLIIVPRGCFKSTLGVVGFSIWSLLKNPNERILIDSELFQNSSSFLREIRAQLESKDFVDLFGEFKSEDNWNQTSITIKQRTKAYKEASITCGGVGTTKVGQHFTIIIGDDYNSPKNSDTQEGQEKIIRHYRYNLSILDPDGTYVVIGTRYAEYDLPGHILGKELNLPSHPKSGVYDSDLAGHGLI